MVFGVDFLTHTREDVWWLAQQLDEQPGNRARCRLIAGEEQQDDMVNDLPITQWRRATVSYSILAGSLGLQEEVKHIGGRSRRRCG